MIAVAMSGGVDSSVAAALLLEAGCDVVGVTLDLRGGRGGPEGDACGGEDAIGRAAKVAYELGIPHHVIDGSSEFEALVLAPAWQEYAHGRTPSPCLLCNERVKFGLLLERARLLGADAIATGHYARIDRDEHGAIMLRRGVDAAKDQSYFLAGLSGEQLAAARFPLGGMLKVEVRDGTAEALPFADHSFDCIVCTFTLCSVHTPAAALAQARRVLKPGGTLLFAEHGLAPDADVEKWQHRIEPLWKKLAGGCHLTRPVTRAIADAGFRITASDSMYLPGTPRFAGWSEWGSATPA